VKRAIWGVAAVIGVVAVGLVASLVAGDPGSEGLATVSASGSSAGASVTSSSTSSTSSTSLAPATTARPPRTTVPTTVAATTPTTAMPITTASTAVATTTTVDPNVAPGPVCAPSMFSTTFTMSKPAFRVGEEVLATSVFRNVSGQTCYLTSTMSEHRILDASGEPATFPVISVGDHFRWVPVPAGATESQNWTWDQRVCRPSVPCVPAVPGRYTFTVDLQPYGSGRAAFDITV
jgi:hypothetical protein